jgi:hypothetical protein
MSIKLPGWHKLQISPLPKVGSLYEASRLQILSKEEERFALCVYSDRKICKFLNAQGKVIEVAPIEVPFLWNKV